MGKTYFHLSPEVCAALMFELARQTSCHGIARLLGRRENLGVLNYIKII